MEGMFNIFTVYSLICVFLPCLLYRRIRGGRVGNIVRLFL